ncbi:hypothetical protein GCM10008940_17150 [Microbulbifer agarilyticus]
MGLLHFSACGGGSLGPGFQDRCEPIPGRFVANILFATILKPRPQRSAFNSTYALRNCVS